MKNLVRAAAIFSGVVGLSGVAAALAVGCSGDDTVIGYGADTGTDSPTADSSSDTSTDSSSTDAGPDTSFSFDAGPPKLGQFYQQITQTGCAWLENCCGGPGNFDMNQCLSTFAPATGGFLYTSPVQDPIDGGGNVTFDQSKASECFSLIQNLSCTAAFTSAQMTAIRNACNGAVVGNIAPGGTGCQATIECQSPAHCEPQGGGTCVAPYNSGDNCILTSDSELTSMARCGRPYTGNPGFCQIGDSQTVVEAGTCAAPGITGTACISPYECQSWLCDINNTATCQTSAQIFVPGSGGTCSSFSLDGG